MLLMLSVFFLSMISTFLTPVESLFQYINWDSGKVGMHYKQFLLKF